MDRPTKGGRENGPRFSRPGDEPGLRELWKRVFGDSDAFLDLFFREIYVPGMAALVEEGGRIVSAAYCVPFGEARYIYAVATAPEHRGRGYFSRLMAYMLYDLRERGFTRAVVGVEPQETRNRAMYHHWGFTEPAGETTEAYPDGTQIQVLFFARPL